VLFVRCTGLQVDHLIDSIFNYFAICRVHNFVSCFLEQVTWLVVTGLVTERRHDIGALCAVTHIFAYWTSPVSVTHVIFFIARFLCDMRALCVYSKFGHYPPQATFVPNFVSVAPSIAELARGEKSRTQLHVLNHSVTYPLTDAYLMDCIAEGRLALMLGMYQKEGLGESERRLKGGVDKRSAGLIN